MKNETLKSVLFIAIGFLLCALLFSYCKKPCENPVSYIHKIDTVLKEIPIDKIIIVTKTKLNEKIVYRDIYGDIIHDTVILCNDSIRDYKMVHSDTMVNIEASVSVLGRLLSENVKYSLKMQPVYTPKIKNKWFIGGMVGSDTTLSAMVHILNKKNNLIAVGNNLIGKQPNFYFGYGIKIGNKNRK